MLFLAAGIGYGRGAGTLRTSTDVIDAITKFNYSNIPKIAAVKLGDMIASSSIGDVWLLLAAMAITLVVGIIMPQAIAKWTLLAPIFIPLFLRIGIEPQTVLAAYRVADSPINIVAPIMAYFPLIVVFAARYDKRSGIGTVIAPMLPSLRGAHRGVDAALRRQVPARHPAGAGGAGMTRPMSLPGGDGRPVTRITLTG